MKFWFLGFLLLAGCYGRIDDASSGRRINAKRYGLDGERPALVVFGAVWCKPCLSEIKYLNRALAEVGGVQISSFVVEGAQKGVAAAPKDTDQFIGPGGVKPEYKIQTDSTWELFDELQPPSGRALPTMVFIGRDQTIVKVVQRSMEYESELLPLLRAIAAGEEPVAQPSPEPEPLPEPGDPDAGKTVSLNFADWTKLAGNAESSLVYQNFHAAWLRGLEDYAFFEEDMPFKAAKMKVFLYDDGRSKPVSSVWNAAMTGCRLTLFLNPDGTYERSEGICK